jgi:hypothetical protein
MVWLTSEKNECTVPCRFPLFLALHRDSCKIIFMEVEKLNQRTPGRKSIRYNPPFHSLELSLQFNFRDLMGEIFFQDFFAGIPFC